MTKTAKPVRPLRHWLVALSISLTGLGLLPAAATGCITYGRCEGRPECKGMSAGACTDSACGLALACADACYRQTQSLCGQIANCQWDGQRCGAKFSVCFENSPDVCATLPYCEVQSVCVPTESCTDFESGAECTDHSGCYWVD